MGERPTNESDLAGLAERLRLKLGGSELAEAAMRAAIERAPDERQAIASLLRLAEVSPAETSRALSDPHLASDLLCCLGASELIGSSFAVLGAAWLPLFQRSR